MHFKDEQNLVFTHQDLYLHYTKFRVSFINVSWWNRSIFSDYLSVCCSSGHPVSVRMPEECRIPSSSAPPSLSLIFYRFSRPNQPIFQRSGARDVTGLFKRCWERSIEDILLFIVCTHQWSASQRKHHRLQNIFFYSNFKFHRLYSVKGHEFKALKGLKEMDSCRFGRKSIYSIQINHSVMIFKVGWENKI